MSLEGDFAALSRLQRALDAVATGELARDVLRVAGPVLSGLVGEGFKNSRAPNGARWKRLKQPRAAGRSNRGGPLYDRGHLKAAATQVWIRADGLAIFVSRPGATTHEYGNEHVPARVYLPRGTALPGPWQRHLNVIANQRFRAFFSEGLR